MACQRRTAEAAAWLHDVVEDTPTTLDDLTETGFPDDVMAVAHTAEGWCHGLAFRMKPPHSLDRKLDLEFDKAAAVAATTGASPIDPQKVAD